MLLSEGHLSKLAVWVPVFVLLSILLVGVFVTPDQIAGTPFCLIKSLTDMDCPGCGMTRAFLLLARGHVLTAMSLNAASPLVYLFFVQMAATLTARALGTPLLDSALWQQARVLQGWLILVLLLGHWGVKTWLFFETHAWRSLLPLGHFLSSPWGLLLP